MEDLRGKHFTEIAGFVTGWRLEVYGALLRLGPSTGSELAARCGMKDTSVRPRLTELHKMGLAEVVTDRNGNKVRRDSEHVYRWVSMADARARWEAANPAPAAVEKAAPIVPVKETQLVMI